MIRLIVFVTLVCLVITTEVESFSPVTITTLTIANIGKSCSRVSYHGSLSSPPSSLPSADSMCVNPNEKVMRQSRRSFGGASATEGRLYMASGGGGGGFFDNIGKFFDEMNNEGGRGGDDNEEEEDYDEDDMDYIGSSRIFTIPAKSIKIGGLRLFLTLYLMGQQNSPEKGAWKANQSGDSTIDLFYCDQSGALMMSFKEDKITIDRLGSAPSTKYLMHESEMLNGLLDELQNIVDGGDVKQDDRLLVLPAPGDAIDRARETIAFS